MKSKFELGDKVRVVQKREVFTDRPTWWNFAGLGTRVSKMALPVLFGRPQNSLSKKEMEDYEHELAKPSKVVKVVKYWKGYFYVLENGTGYHFGRQRGFPRHYLEKA